MDKHPSSLPDEILAKMARAGDKTAFDALCDRYLSVIYNHLRAKLPPEAVEDLTQQVFIEAVKSIRHYQECSPFRTWILSIACSRVANYYHHHSCQPEERSLNPGSEGRSHGSEQRNVGQERVLVRRALKRLSQPYQEILILRFVEGMQFQEIASILEISPKAAKSRYRRAVAAMAQEMGIDAR